MTDDNKKIKNIAMEIPTVRIEAVRVSSNSLKRWTLYGAIDQALKTTIQARSVRAHTLKVTVHGIDLELEMWTSAATEGVHGEAPNAVAMAMLAIQKMRARGEDTSMVILGESEDMMLGAISLSENDVIPVPGPAIITGMGCADFPDSVPLGCVFAALIGQHDEE